ncbi:ABC transporter permease subunit [Klebsiella variicola subsp. variicola]|nr:ABC transporter permease subunit [Klebsiella variicola subsp. variicola]
MTLLITLCSLLCGVVLGPVLALLQEAPFRAGKGLAFFYLWLFRGTPVLFQIIFVYNVLPGFGLRFSAFTCAVLALSLNEGRLHGGNSALWPAGGEKRPAHRRHGAGDDSRPDHAKNRSASGRTHRSAADG